MKNTAIAIVMGSLTGYFMDLQQAPFYVAAVSSVIVMLLAVCAFELKDMNQRR